MGYRIRFETSCAFLLAAFVSVGCSGTDSMGAAAGDTVYIGVAAARTGLTDAYFNGVRLAIDELNGSREPGDRPFGLRMPPEEQPSQVAVAAAFRDDPGVIGVVGHTGSAQSLEAAPVYGDMDGGGQRALVAITPTATNPLVTRASPWVFRVCPTDDDAARALARFAADTLGTQRAAIIYRNDLFGRGFSRTFQETFESAGARVLERDPYLSGITEFEAYAGRIAKRAADAVVIAGGATDVAEIVGALRGAGVRPAILGSDDLAGLGADPEAAREFAGLRYTAFFLADRPVNEPGARFALAYRTRFGVDPDHRAALSYDAAMLIGRAAIAVGPQRRAVRDHISRIGQDEPAHPGVTGSIEFDSWGDPVRKPVLIAELAP